MPNSHNFVFLLSPVSNKNQVKKIIVMCTSALWHGLYPGPTCCPIMLLIQAFYQLLSCHSFKHFANVLAGYYCTFLLASFWSEAEKKLFILVSPVSKVFFPTFFSVPFASWYCDCSFPNVFPPKILPHAVRRAVAIVWTILLLNYMTVRLRHYGLMLNVHSSLWLDAQCSCSS